MVALIGIPALFLLASLLITLLLGRYMAAVFDDKPTWLDPLFRPLEKLLLRVGGHCDATAGTWQRYCRDLLLFNLFCGLLAFGIIRCQGFLPLNPLHFPGIEPLQAFNTLCSFVSNTNWQSYSGELALSNLSQMTALTFWMVIGAASGIAVCIAFLRGLSHRPLGHFYPDLIRTMLYVFLPVLVASGLFFMSQGVPQTLTQQTTAHTVEGGAQKIALGPVASLLAIKQFGTNGGGFFNANSAHPFENPNPLTNFVEIMLELSIPMALTVVFGRWLNDRRQGWMIWGAMMAMFLVMFGLGWTFEQAGNPALSLQTASMASQAPAPEASSSETSPLETIPIDQAHSAFQSGGNMEGKEARFGILPSMLFTTATTATSSGAVNNMHDSLTPIGGLVPLANMMLNVIFGGVGVGLMNFLLYGIIAVFLTGLMVGRTPEIFGKKIEKPEIILASVAILLHPFIILVPSAIAAVSDFGVSSLNNAGPHGLSEILYAYTSAGANNGSAFAGLNANTPWYNLSLGIVILLGRYPAIIALLAIAGSLLAKPVTEVGPGTLRTNTALFTLIWLGVILVVGALTFVPVLALGPVAEHLAMLTDRLF